MATKTTTSTSSRRGASAAMPQQVFMVGNSNALAEIKYKLTNRSIKEREVISITGMGGIGKTTLAKKVYEDEGIKRHFDIRAWITVSQSYSLDDLLQMLLQSIKACSPTEEQSRTLEPNDKVRKLLMGKRYLIAIDDVWSIEVWDHLQIYFPEDFSNGSRVLLTTRLKFVANYASSGRLQYSMSTLSEEESWDLFCKKVFAKESTCIEFEKIGRDIVMKCKGLPLSIMVIAGILSKAEMKVEDWENIAKDVVALSSTLYEEQNCEKILLLSYNHLPENLKTCFLYLGVYPEDYEILARTLVGHWMAWEFVEDEALVANKEEMAWQKLQDLIDRNLILVEKRGRRGRIKTCKIHDLTREMCLRLAKGKNMLHVIDEKSQVGQSSREPNQKENDDWYFWVSLQSIPKNCRRISDLGLDRRSLEKCHSFLAMFPSDYTFESYRGTPILTYNLFTSIQVLDLLHLYLPFFPSPRHLNNLNQLRYLALYIGSCGSSLLNLSTLKNLQTFVLRINAPYIVHLTLPKTPQLMQLCISMYSSFHFKDEEDNLIWENLTTLLWLSDFCCENEALMVRIPNVKKLGVRYEEPKYRDSKHPIDLLHTLSKHLEQLENISFFGSESLRKAGLVYIPKPAYDFPPKLKKLKFCMTWMKLGIMMTILGRLPNLQVLQLEYGAFDDSETEWEQVEEEGFPKLKVLVFQDLKLRRWKDSDFTFPCLECLVLKNCSTLKSLPYECLSGSPCLKLIDLEGCSDDVLESAKKIQNDGDDQLEVRQENIYQLKLGNLLKMFRRIRFR